jgi:glycosyltransferase involved in cell wall biosynthesis/SAM-dependent methyltransferase
VDVCTVIAKNYLPAARVLADSLAEHHPGVTLHVLVIDEWEGFIDPARERFEIVDPEAIGVPDLARMRSLYTVLEYSTAVKPWLLRHLLARDGADGIVYLDPDIRLYAPIDDVFAAVREHGLVLNPHNTGPMPRDGRKPNEQDILIAGAYNLGFLGLRDDRFGAFLLDWWGERLETDCIVDPERGFFVDQRWMDLVPGLAEDFHLVRDPGFNVAYWNLGSRVLARAEDGGALVDGEPLRLFHFSGFRADKPHSLSTHQDRIRLGDDPVLAELCAGYAQALRDAGFDDAKGWAYSWNTTASGLAIDRTMRLAYRDAVESGDVEGSLFDHDGEREFLEWAALPAATGGRHGVTRYHAALYELRPDLEAAYPDLEDAGVASGFLGWVRVHGASELGIPEELLPPAAEEPPPPEVPGPLVPPLGANVAGYLNAELGVGEVARQVVSALDANGVPLLPVGLHAPNNRAGHVFAASRHIAAPFGTNIVCVNADGLPAFAEQAGPAFFDGRYTVGVWWWELSRFPQQWHGAFDLVDEIWAGSRFVADALSEVAPVPVVVMPLPLAPVRRLPADHARFGLDPAAFTFLFSYDYNSVFERKNPLGTVAAFRAAFGDDPGVQLVLKCINEDKDEENHDRLRIAIEGAPNIHLIAGYLDPAEKHLLTATCDAFVSLHRSEGFGLGLAEAMMLGKPVVATDYGGSTDFVDEGTGFPVRFGLIPVGDDAWPYPPEMQWADPDLDHAAEQLRAVVADPAHAGALAARGADRLERVHNPYAAGARMARRLATIDGRRDAPPPPTALAGIPDPDPSLLARIERGPVPPPNSPLGPASRFARRLALRLMKPYTAHARTVQHDLATGLREQAQHLRQAVSNAQIEGAMADAAQLAEARRLAAGARDASTSARIDDLVTQVDELRLQLQVQRAELAAAGLPVTSADGATPVSAVWPEAPAGEPWDEAYTAAHRDFVARELDDAELIGRFRSGERLPDRFGVGFDERVVEFPWVSAQRLSGDVLDAGSALNHLHVLSRLRPRVDDLHIVTLAPEQESFPALHVSYLFADLRELPIVDGRYDRIVSISTLEHVGTDTSYYGGSTAVVTDVQAEAVRVMQELNRVLKPGGDLYLTLPVGRPDRFSWVRALSLAEVDELVDAFAPAESTLRLYGYTADGWQVAERDDVADARYRDHFSSGPVGADRAPAARAVACIHLVKPDAAA